MITLIALYLASHTVPDQTIDYKVDHCYASNKENVPNVIKIIRVTKLNYFYKQKLSDTEWSRPLKNSKETIHSVYFKNVKCQ